MADSTLRRKTAATLAVAVLAVSPVARAGTTVHFPFDDDRYLRADQHDGGTAYVPDSASAEDGAVPIVVFLHGINPAGELHVWMEGDHDLRPVVDTLTASGAEPFVLAAPSQTRDAGRGRFLWPDFDIDAFVAQTAAAVARHVDVDARRVYVVGHSGAGCNASGGIVAAAQASRARVRGVLAVDTCLDADSGGAFAQIPARVPVWVTWQDRTWPRDSRRVPRRARPRGDARAHPAPRRARAAPAPGDCPARVSPDGARVAHAERLRQRPLEVMVSRGGWEVTGGSETKPAGPAPFCSQEAPVAESSAASSAARARWRPGRVASALARTTRHGAGGGRSFGPVPHAGLGSLPSVSSTVAPAASVAQSIHVDVVGAPFTVMLST